MIMIFTLVPMPGLMRHMTPRGPPALGHVRASLADALDACGSLGAQDPVSLG